MKNGYFVNLREKIIKNNFVSYKINIPVSIALVSRIFGSIFVFIFNVLISRLLGASDSGAFFFSLAIITLITIISRLGLDQAALKYISCYSGSNNKSSIIEF